MIWLPGRECGRNMIHVADMRRDFRAGSELFQTGRLESRYRRRWLTVYRQTAARGGVISDSAGETVAARCEIQKYASHSKTGSLYCAGLPMNGMAERRSLSMENDKIP